MNYNRRLFFLNWMNENLNDVLVKGLGKKATLEFAELANADKNFYSQLLRVIDKGETTPAMKASWILGTAARLDAQPAQRQIEKLIGLLEKATIGGVQRELLKVLEVVKMNPESEGIFVDYCFKLIQRPGIDVGIRYYCLRILKRALKKYPDLKGELIMALEEIQDWHNAPWKRYITKALNSLHTADRRR